VEHILFLPAIEPRSSGRIAYIVTAVQAELFRHT